MSVPSVCMLCVEAGNPQVSVCQHDVAFAAAYLQPVHEYPPVWDSTLKAWINQPPYPTPGRGPFPFPGRGANRGSVVRG